MLDYNLSDHKASEGIVQLNSKALGPLQYGMPSSKTYRGHAHQSLCSQQRTAQWPRLRLAVNMATTLIIE
jgi:hypothetical protein